MFWILLLPCCFPKSWARDSSPSFLRASAHCAQNDRPRTYLVCPGPVILSVAKNLSRHSQTTWIPLVLTASGNHQLFRKLHRAASLQQKKKIVRRLSSDAPDSRVCPYACQCAW